MQRLLLLFMAILVYVPAQATTVLRLSVEEMARRADLVVRAEVTRVEVQSDPTDEARITTHVTMRVLDTFKGHQTAPTLTLKLLGGSNGRYILRVPGMPTFSQGEEVVLFLHATPRGFMPAGLWLGKYKVLRGEGPARAVRIPADCKTFTLEGGKLAEEVGVSHGDDSLDLDVLVRRIRAGATMGGGR